MAERGKPEMPLMFSKVNISQDMQRYSGIG